MNGDGLSSWAARLAKRTSLSQAVIDAILSLPSRVMRYEAHQNIVSIGERVNSVFVVADGIVGQFAQSRTGTRAIVALHLAGEAANLPSAMLPNACCSQTALTAVELLAIPHQAIHELNRSSPRVFEALSRSICVDAAISEQWLLRNSRLDAVQRLAHCLCEMTLRLRPAGSPKPTLRLPITQANVSDILGVTSVHVNRILRDLRERALADWTRGIVRILDWPALRALGQFDPTYLHLPNGEA